jgi:hypothetical protein
LLRAENLAERHAAGVLIALYMNDRRPTDRARRSKQGKSPMARHSMFYLAVPLLLGLATGVCAAMTSSAHSLQLS